MNDILRDFERVPPEVVRRASGFAAGRNLRPQWLDGSLRAAGLLKEGETL